MKVNGLAYYCTCGLLSILMTHGLFWGEIGRRLGVYHEIYLLVSIFLCMGMSFFVYRWFDVGSRLLEVCKCIAIVMVALTLSFFLSSVFDVFNIRNSHFIFYVEAVPLLFIYPLLLLKGWVTMCLVTLFSLIIYPRPKKEIDKPKEIQ